MPLWAEPTSVELILDCSGSMWNKLSDGRYRIDAAKQVISEFIATAPEKEDLHIGLRLYGSKVSHRESGACEDTVLVVPIEGFQRSAMLKLVKDARAIGATPLAISLNAAVDDFTKPGQKQVIVFTDGEESCGGDVAAALARLKAEGVNADVRIIGIGLPPAVAERFAVLAPIENANSVVRLAEALKKATSSTVAAPAAPMIEKQKVTVKVTRDAAPLVEGDVTLMTIDQVPLKLVKNEEPGTWTGELVPGIYTANVGPSGRSFPGLIVSRGVDALFTLDVTELPKVTVEVPQEEIFVMQPLVAIFEGAKGLERQYLYIAPEGSEDEQYIDFEKAPGLSGKVEFRTPDLPGRYEARFIQLDAASTAVVCGRSKVFEVKAPKVTLEMPVEVPANEPVTVKFQATVNPNDWIGWVEEGAADGDYKLYARPMVGKAEVVVNAPAEPGNYEMRYANDGANTPFARRAFKVIPATFVIEAPATAMAGSQLSVKWKAPLLSTLFITIVAKGSDGGAYNDYYRLDSAAQPVKLTAPRTPGEMEIRISSESESKVLFSQPLQLTEMQASVKGPAEVAVSTPIAIEWTGPAGKGDYLTITKVGAGDSEYLSYVYTLDAEPKVEIKAPEEAGDYELRYTTETNQVLARQPIRVK